MGYDAYKVLYVTRPRPKQAWRTVIWESRQPYAVLRHNCSDVVYDILRSYGTSGLLDPVEELASNDWYDGPVVDFQRRDEWNGRCIFRPKGKCYDTAMNIFVMLNMVNCYDSNVERALCREWVSFDWRGIAAMKKTMPSIR
jgi:hypothetical protein